MLSGTKLAEALLSSLILSASGAIAVDVGASVTVTGAKFVENVARSPSGYGGAMNVANAGRVTISDSTFVSDAAAKGAALFLRSASIVSVSNSSFQNFKDGAAVFSIKNVDDGDDAALRLLDGVSFDNLAIPAVSGEHVAVANCEGLARADFEDTTVLKCARASSLCPRRHCRDGVAEVGVQCVCDVAGKPQSATVCASTAQVLPTRGPAAQPV